MQMLEYVKPFILLGSEFIQTFAEMGQRQVDKHQLVVKNMPILIFKLDGVHHFIVVTITIFLKHEIEDANRINRRQLIIPIAPLCLLLNRESGIVQAAILEKNSAWLSATPQ